MGCLRLLLVDDDEATRYVVKRALRTVGEFTLHEAASAEEATLLLERHPVDVILTDFRMPGKTGVDLLCHALERHPAVRRILMSGALSEAMLHEAAAVACVHHAFEKPLEREGWARALREAFQAAGETRNALAGFEGDGASSSS